VNKVVKNLAFSIFPQLINVISNLILPGLIIAKFGSEMNGLVSTTKNVVSYIGLVGAGITTTVTQALYDPVANKDYDTVKGMLNAAGNMFNRYGGLYLFITFASALIYPYFIQSEIQYFTIAGLLLVMGISGVSELFAIGRSKALLFAHQKVYICSLVQTISLIISLLLTLVLLKLNAGIITVQFGISSMYILWGGFMMAYIRKVYPEYSDYRKYSPINTTTQKHKDAMIHQLTGVVISDSQATILTAFVGLKAASIYSVYNVVLSGIKTICFHLSTAITPYFGEKYALKQTEQLRNLYDLVEFAFSYFTAFVLSVTSVMLLPFISLYTKGADINHIYPTFAFLFVISSAFFILKLPGSSLIIAAGHFKETRWRAILESGLCLVLNIVCTIPIGMNGVLLGTGCALGWRCWDTIVYTNKYILDKSPKKSFIRVLITFGNILLLQLASHCFSWIPNNFSEWFVMALFVSVAVLVLLLLEMFLFERKLLTGIIKKAFKQNA